MTDVKFVKLEHHRAYELRGTSKRALAIDGHASFTSNVTVLIVASSINEAIRVAEEHYAMSSIHHVHAIGPATIYIPLAVAG